jgi:excisionase family DNA binding protein
MAKTDQPMLTYTEAANRLGVSARYVRRMVSEGRLEVVRIGHRTVRVPESTVNAFISNHREG